MSSYRIGFDDGNGGVTDAPPFATSNLGQSIQVNICLISDRDELDPADDVTLNLLADRGMEFASDQSVTVDGFCSLVIDGPIINSQGVIHIIVNDDGMGTYTQLEFYIEVLSIAPPAPNEGGAVGDLPTAIVQNKPVLFLTDIEDLFDIFF